MRPITDVLRDIRKGRVVDIATDKLAEVVQAVVETGKPGELNLKLKIKTKERGDNCVTVSAEVTQKIPQLSLPDAIFFANAGGDLLRDDPTQMRMFADADEVRRGQSA